MPTTLTSDQILALAPDTSSASSGRGLANTRKWASLGQSDVAVWGECQGSGKDPYRVQIDLREPAFRCSCPSRKFPCKHGIGLLLLLANQPAAIPAGDAPAWVSEWLGKRDQSAQKKAETKSTPPDPTTEARRTAAQSRAVAAREAKVAAGLADLERWLRDQVRQGLATLQGQGARPWDTMAARMVDAQAPGVARLLRAMGGLPASGEGWQGRLMERIARAHLLIEGYKRRDALPPDLLLELRTQIGWAQDQDTVRAGPPVGDSWLAVGQRVEEEDGLRVQRTWLWGLETGRAALLLFYAAQNQSLERSLVVGTALAADMAFFGGTYPLRALMTERRAQPITATELPGYPSIDAGVAAYSAALARNPWLEQFPMPLRGVTPVASGGGWLARDSEGRMLPLRIRGAQGWRMLALSGGRPLDLFGEWDGQILAPLSLWADGRVRHLRQE